MSRRPWTSLRRQAGRNFCRIVTTGTDLKYRLLKCYPTEYDTRKDDNHIYIHAVADDEDYSLAINVQSNVTVSRLYYCVKEYSYIPGKTENGEVAENGALAQTDPVIDSFIRECSSMEDGLHIPKQALNYGGDDLVKAADMQPAESDEVFDYAYVNGRWIPRRHPMDTVTNKLSEVIVKNARLSMDHPASFIVAVGRLWGPKDEEDWTFGFTPAQGIHDIHANDDGRDGALFFFHPNEEKVTAVYTRFRNVQ